MYRVPSEMNARTKVDPEPRRRGRPAESDGLTGERILIAARVCFAESGYAGASTHMVAARVGLTTGRFTTTSLPNATSTWRCSARSSSS